MTNVLPGTACAEAWVRDPALTVASEFVARKPRSQHHHSMPFFEPPAEPPIEFQVHAAPWSPPAWDRPSEGTLPAVVGIGRLLGRTEDVAVAVDYVRVYPNGFQIAISSLTSPHREPDLRMGGFMGGFRTPLIARSKATTDDGNAAPPPPSPRLRPHADMGPRIGVRFSNGQRATADWQSMFDVAKDDDGIPTEPVIVNRGGGGGTGGFRFEYWVFPLPTPGQLEVFVEWASAGIEETSIAISGDDIREAAQHAIVLWS